MAPRDALSWLVLGLEDLEAHGPRVEAALAPVAVGLAGQVTAPVAEDHPLVLAADRLAKRWGMSREWVLDRAAKQGFAVAAARNARGWPPGSLERLAELTR